MKKILLLLLFVSYGALSQSVLLTPDAISKKNSNVDDITMQSYATYPSIIGLRANGTVALPTAIASDDVIMQLGVRGYTGVGGFSTSRANIRFKATQNWTNTANGTSITFETTPNNSTTRTERMVINHDGFIGVGTIPSSYILDINGRTRIRHNGSTAGLWFNKSDNTEGAFTGMYDNNIFGFFGMGTVSNWKFAFDLVNTKMGIGSFSPKHPLTFSSAIGDKISFWGGETATTDNHYGIGIQGSVLQLFVPSASENIVFGTGRSGSFTEKMRINGGGNVGIGVNNPTSTLAVTRGTGVNGTAAFYGTTHTSHFNYFTSEDTYIRGGKVNSKVFINDLTGLGSVQVGESATPTGYKMSIDGKVICTEMEVLVTPWPDYVFRSNYKLKPLQEIENFIAKNGHLPNIPKAKDIENKSLALGNMAKLQMEKIEELTLYLIEINKRLEKIEGENLMLKTELKTIKSQN
jgi:hypothetical protein